MSAVPGRRIRVLMEWFDAGMSGPDAETFLKSVLTDLEPRYGDAIVATYIEVNPPADEI